MHGFVWKETIAGRLGSWMCLNGTYHIAFKSEIGLNVPAFVVANDTPAKRKQARHFWPTFLNWLACFSVATPLLAEQTAKERKNQRKKSWSKLWDPFIRFTHSLNHNLALGSFHMSHLKMLLFIHISLFYFYNPYKRNWFRWILFFLFISLFNFHLRVYVELKLSYLSLVCVCLIR